MADDADGWRFSQVFGDRGIPEEITEADIISCVEFNNDGQFLATGDKGGRIVIFERCPSSHEYKFYTEFQSHECEFDYLKSLEIEEKINKIRWLQHSKTHSRSLLSTNDKTIKLWKIFERPMVELVPDPDLPIDPSSITSREQLRLPRVRKTETVVAAQQKKVYANAHAYHVNSISINSDQELFLSADDLRINLWHLDKTDQSFNIVDIKPVNMEELQEVITAAEFHPSHCNVFAYSSSKGTMKLCDMRAAALCDQHAKVLEEEEDPSTRSFFSEIISSISDIRFSNGGNHIISRDYLNVKLWDLRMENGPVRTFCIHENLRNKFCDLYENDCIFDKFECTWSGNDSHIVTGSYHNHFYLLDTEGQTEVVLQASKQFGKGQQVAGQTMMRNGQVLNQPINPDMINFAQKIMHTSWHPTEDIIAVAATNFLYMFDRV
eukprot:Clim_evm22s13 gene=Clim_evmTU22s13